MQLHKTFLSFVAVSVASLGLLTAAIQVSAQTTTASSGQLIRGESFPAVYYMGADGFRYVFPNDKAYFTWYENFNDVIWLTDADLAKIQIGGNVTYKPGVKMVKINTDPKTYAIEKGGTLRHVTSEEIARTLYGTNWNTMIDDIPDSFFSNYTVGEPITSASDYSAEDAENEVDTINEDMELTAPETVLLTDSGFSPSTITIQEGETVLFKNTGSDKHTATAEDGSWGSGTLNSGDTYVRRFDDAGVYEFYDSYNEDETGTIEVE